MASAPENWFDAVETINKWVAAARQEVGATGRQPTLEALAEKSGVSAEEARRVIDLARIIVDIP